MAYRYCWLQHWSTLQAKLVSHRSGQVFLLRRYLSKSVLEKKYGAVVQKERSESSSNPLIVILGWNDCKVKTLKKYSLIFEKKDWPTVCLPTTSVNTFLRTDTEAKRISYHMMDLIKELTRNEKKVVFFSLSNGGIAVYFHIAEALTRPGNQYFNAFQIAGSIFDSTPTKPDMESIIRAQISVTENVKNPFFRAIIWKSFGLLLPFFVEGNVLLERFFQDLGNMPLTSPELFLYSKSDKLSLFGHIEEHIGNRKSRGIQVFSKCWEDSEHVAHYMKYPAEYVEEIENFLKLCNLS